MATLIVEVTHRCPCRCRECPVPLEVRREGRIMPLSDFRRVLEVFASRFDEDLYLIISGGEPSLLPNLRDYVRLGKRLGYRVTVVTNAFRPDVIKECGADLVEVSLDYASPIKHDNYRGVPGLWSRAYWLAKELYPGVAVRATWYGDNTEDILWLASEFPGRVVCMPAVLREGSRYYILEMDQETRSRLRDAGVILPRGCDHSRFATVDPYLNVYVCPFVRIYVGKFGSEALDRLSRLKGCPAAGQTIKMGRRNLVIGETSEG